MSNKTNRHRAERAFETLKHYVRREKHETFIEDPVDESDITDLIADLMHLCEVEGISFEECLRMGKIHHEAEVNGEDDYLDEE